MAVTLQQIATETGFSCQTVGFILGGKAHLFRPTTRTRVLDAAKRLGYRPNASARSVRTGRFDAIAILLSSEGDGRSSLFTGFVNGVEGAAHQAGLHLIVTALPDRQLTDTEFAPKILREAMSDGLLINYYRHTPARLEELVEKCQIPSIWTNTKRASDCVHPDDFGASRAATRKLIEQGHRRIGYADCVHGHPLVPSSDHYSAFDRQAGYLAAMREANLSPRMLLPERKQEGTSVTAALLDWLRPPERPTAVVTYCSIDVVGIVQAAPQLGLRIPEDLALVTHEEEPACYGIVPVTTMLIPSLEMGKVAVEMLSDKIANPARSLSPRAITFQEHESTP